MSTTKEKIIRAAAELFHIHGVDIVRLQQIADRSAVSVGNLAYHYKNKDAIVLEVYAQLSQEAKEILQLFRHTPTFIDLNDQLDRWFSFHQSYSFYFSAILPAAVAPLREQVVFRLVHQLNKRIEFHEQRGAMQPADKHDMYPMVAQTVSLVITHWPSYQRLRSEAANKKQFKRLIWSQWLPYLTSRGKTEYQALIYPTVTPLA